MNSLEQTLERLFDVDVLLGRGLAHKHKVIVLRKLLNLCNRHLSAPRVFVDQVDLVGDQRYLARLLAVLAQLRQPVVEALEALPIRQVEYQQGTHCLSIVSHDYGSIALTPTGVPDLCWYADCLSRILLNDLKGFCLKFDSYGWNLSSEDTTIITLQYVWFAYPNMAR